MSRKPARVTQADIARAIRAARQCCAGCVKIAPDGSIIIETSKSERLNSIDDALDVAIEL